MKSAYSDPFLSKFDPLARILFADDFDTGMCGWSELIGNYEGSLDTILPPFRDLRPPMLSSATMWDTGTAGVALRHVFPQARHPRPRAVIWRWLSSAPRGASGAASKWSATSRSSRNRAR